MLSLLSDDDHELQPLLQSGSSKQSQKSARKENRPVILGDIIEISSDEDDESPAFAVAKTRKKNENGVAMAELQERFRKLEQVCLRRPHLNTEFHISTIKETANIKEENKRILLENTELKNRVHLVRFDSCLNPSILSRHFGSAGYI